MPGCDPRLVDLFLELAAIEGLSGAERGIADRVIERLRGLGLDPVEADPASCGGGDAGNIVCRVGSGGDRVLLSHLDTARSTRGLKPLVHDDRITSDGSTVLGVDNRAGVAALLYATEQCVAKGIPGDGYTLAFTVCEETSLAGSRNLVLDPAVRKGFAFDSSKRPGHFIAQSYGARRFEIRVRGKASHSGLAPEDGINALQVAAIAVAALPWGRVDPKTTANVSTFSSESPINVVPELARLEGEVRSLKRRNVDEATQAIRDRFDDAARAAGAVVDFECRWDFEPYTLASDSAIYRTVESVLRQESLQPQPVISPGGSDVNSLNARGLPAVNLGIGAQNPHTDEEFILLEDLDRAARMALRLTGG